MQRDLCGETPLDKGIPVGMQGKTATRIASNISPAVGMRQS
jgi:hypothetical protein